MKAFEPFVKLKGMERTLEMFLISFLFAANWMGSCGVFVEKNVCYFKFIKIKFYIYITNSYENTL